MVMLGFHSNSSGLLATAFYHLLFNSEGSEALVFHRNKLKKQNDLCTTS